MRRLDDLRQPAIENGARLSGEVLSGQAGAQSFTVLGAALLLAVLAYTVGNAGLLLLAPMTLSGLALGGWVYLRRAIGEDAWSLGKLASVTDPDLLRVHASELEEALRRARAKAAVALLLFAVTGVWAYLSDARALVVIGCPIVLAYVTSSIKPVVSGRVSLEELGSDGDASQCRILLFRSFEPGASDLTRNALIPILAGYGRVEVVVDPTLADARPSGEFGVEVREIDAVARVHRFEDHAWKAGVEGLIRGADVAVLEATRLTPGLAWEFGRCLTELPPWRVYPAVDLERLGEIEVDDHLRRFYEVVGPEMPPDVRLRWFFLGPGALQQRALAMDLHHRLSLVVGIESGRVDPSAFGPGAERWVESGGSG